MMNSKIGRVGVLMGGPSSERDISLKSGRAVYRALKRQGLDVVALDVGSRPENKIKRAGLKIAFIALHGRFGEDGKIQKILESLNIAYTGSRPIASFLCLDKLASRRMFEQLNLPVPEYEFLHRANYKQHLKALRLKCPLVVKPANEGSSIGVSFVNKVSGLVSAAELAFKYDQTVIIEKYIRGREITVGILNEQPLPVVEIVPKQRFFNFQAKYEKGQTKYFVPAEIAKPVYARAQEIALLAHKALGCRGFSRADMILKDDTPFILEINSIPGLTETSLLPLAAKASGISFEQLCLRIVRSAVNGEW